MSIVRYCKAALVAMIAVFFTVVAFDNVTDYGSNWLFVQHVLSMDSVFPDSTLRWRAVTDPSLQAAGYWLIILWEALTAAVLWIGAVQMLTPGAGSRYAYARATAAVGLSMGLLLYGLGFIIVGGEWFAMWQSKTWNGQQTAFEFMGMIGVVLVIVLQAESTD